MIYNFIPLKAVSDPSLFKISLEDLSIESTSTSVKNLFFIISAMSNHGSLNVLEYHQ